MSSFLIKELMRTALTKWRILLWILGGVCVAACAFVIFLVLWVARGEWGENRLIVLFEPGVSSEQIRQVYRQVREWEVISEVLYILRDDPRAAQDGIAPERTPAGYLRVTVRQVAQTAEAQAALRELPGVADVQSYQKGALRALLASDSGACLAATIVQGCALLIFLIALATAMRVLVRAWQGELEILYLSGVSPGAVRGAFFSVAMACSMLSGILALAAVYFAKSVSVVRHWVPELGQPGSFEYVSLMGLGIALLAGIGAGVFGAWEARRRA